jgi:hypothetical protein
MKNGIYYIHVLAPGTLSFQVENTTHEKGIGDDDSSAADNDEDAHGKTPTQLL